MLKLFMVLCSLIAVGSACDEPNPNCANSVVNTKIPNYQGYCNGKPVSYSNYNCTVACSYLWASERSCKTTVSTNCNIFGCDCENCALNADITMNSDDLPASYPFDDNCLFYCSCKCDTGPYANAGQDPPPESYVDTYNPIATIAIDPLRYANATIARRRQIISERFCKSGLVSYEFVQHLEEIADTNSDGMITISEFVNARDGSRVTVSPGFGCVVSGDIARVFPNISLLGCSKTHQHGRRKR